MTSPNEWWKEEPYAVKNYCDMPKYNCDCSGLDFNVPLIIEEVKRRESKRFSLLMKVNLTAIEIMREKKNDPFVGGAIGMCADLLENLMKENGL